MTEDRDQDEFVRGFLKALSAKAPLHKWGEVYTPPHNVEGESVIAAIGRGVIWLGRVTTFDQPTAVAICRELQETIDAARALHGD